MGVAAISSATVFCRWRDRKSLILRGFLISSQTWVDAGQPGEHEGRNMSGASTPSANASISRAFFDTLCRSVDGVNASNLARSALGHPARHVMASHPNAATSTQVIDRQRESHFIANRNGHCAAWAGTRVSTC
jgi:hypothetical protein